MADRTIRVFIVDDHEVVRRGMRAFFALVPDIEVVGEAADGRAALDEFAIAASTGTLPDVVLLDLVMPRLDGVATIQGLKRAYPDVQVVALTSFSEAERVHAALTAGASGYLLKDADAEEVAAAVRAAYTGEVHLDAAVARKLTQSLVGGLTGPNSLSPRERDVLVLVARGHSNQQIADILVVSERTARTHVSNILLKLNLSSRTQAALWAIKEGLVSVL